MFKELGDYRINKGVSYTKSEIEEILQLFETFKTYLGKGDKKGIYIDNKFYPHYQAYMLVNKDSKVTSDEIVLDLRERSIDDAICIINLLERICPTIITDLYKGKYGECYKYVMYTEKHFVIRLRQDQISTNALNFLLRYCKDIRVMLLVDDTLEKCELVREMEWFRDRDNKLEKERNDNCDSLK